MQSNNNANVLIVGAGPSGLVLALSLLQNGLSVRIIDKSPNHMIGQRGAGITPRTLEHYKLLGILPEIEKAQSSIPKLRVYPSPEVDGGEEPPERDMLEVFEPRPEFYRINGAMLGQEDHLTVLRDILSKKYNCTVELSTELVSFSQHPDHDYVTVRTRDVKTGIEQDAQFDWLVGTDGAHSIVRKSLGLTFLGETVETNTLVIGDIEVLDGPELRNWTVWGNYGDKMYDYFSFHRLLLINGSDRLTLRHYHREGKNYHWLILGGKNIDIHKAAADREELVKYIHETIGKKKYEYGELRTAAAWKANIRMVNKFGAGRVFIAGDAAHVHSPTGGQGMNSGVQDSINLAWKLSLAHKHKAPLSLLESYTTERLPVIASMLNKTTELMYKTFTLSDTADAWVRGWDLRQFGVNYRASPITLDERYVGESEVDPYRSGQDGSARAGDRAPDAPGLIVTSDREKKRLFDLFSPVRHTILVFSSDSGAKDILDSLDSDYLKDITTTTLILPQGTAPTPNAVVDGEGFAYKHYNVNPGETWIVVVRPDSYIGAVVKDGEGVRKYFDRILG
ncbi:hypothetical protein VNI00_010229 [Paramarasmius palmivorus]|uniref:FAD-binding domain-containing protein n=1 Tax=Paramarasmius palmivorus TaxID=297713 RepID=A0AAW0BY35_9AGAR